MSRFNYLISCHNSEALIERVLHGVLLSSSKAARIFVVLDACTDQTEAIVRSLMTRHDNIFALHAEDVHELRSINIGLRAADQTGDGYNIILQDDVILQEVDLEQQVEQLYRRIPNLGYTSFRLGFNLAADGASKGPYLQQCDEIESAYGAGVAGEMLLPGRFAYRTVPIKSPVCLPSKLVREIGIFNEDLAPYAYDDADLAIRAIMAGYVNGVYGIRFTSDVRWGGTRRPGHPDIMPTAIRNAEYIRSRYADALMIITAGKQRTEQVEIRPLSPEDEAKAGLAWACSKALLVELNP